MSLHNSIDDNMQVKITDNALARDLFPMDYHCLGDNENRPVRWMALESLLNNDFSSASDVVRTALPDIQRFFLFFYCSHLTVLSVRGVFVMKLTWTFPVSQGFLIYTLIFRSQDTEKVIQEMAPIVFKPFLDAWSRCQKEGRCEVEVLRLWFFPLSCLRIAERAQQRQSGSWTDPQETLLRPAVCPSQTSPHPSAFLLLSHRLMSPTPPTPPCTYS